MLVIKSEVIVRRLFETRRLDFFDAFIDALQYGLLQETQANVEKHTNIEKNRFGGLLLPAKADRMCWHHSSQNVRRYEHPRCIMALSFAIVTNPFNKAGFKQVLARAIQAGRCDAVR